MNTYYVGSVPVTDELYHHGIKGQKWGIRRYQNPDGSLTQEGIRRYGTVENFNRAQAMKKAKSDRDNAVATTNSNIRSRKIKKAIKIGASIAASGLLVYGGYKLSKVIEMNNEKFAEDIFKSKLSAAIKSRDNRISDINRGLLGNDPSIESRRERLLSRIMSNANRDISDASREYRETLSSNIFKKVSNAYKYLHG